MAALVAGLTKPAIQLVGLGAVAVFVGIGMLAPVVARPVAGGVGRPLAGLLGISGKQDARLHAEPAAHGPDVLGVDGRPGPGIDHRRLRRLTSKSATSSVDEAVSADYIITSSGNGSGSFSSSVATEAEKVPGVGAVSTVYSGQFEIRGSPTGLTAVAADHLADTVILRMDAGSGQPALARGTSSSTPPRPTTITWQWAPWSGPPSPKPAGPP